MLYVMYECIYACISVTFFRASSNVTSNQFECTKLWALSTRNSMRQLHWPEIEHTCNIYVHVCTYFIKNSPKNAVKEAGLNAVINGMSIRRAARLHNLSERTLSSKFRWLHWRDPGGQTSLSKREEESIVAHIIKLGDAGMPLDPLELRIITKNHLDYVGRSITEW